MACSSPPKRQKTEDAQTDGCVYPISYDALVLVCAHLSVADLYYTAFASTVFYEIAMREMQLRGIFKDRCPGLYYPHGSYPCCVRNTLDAKSGQHVKTTCWSPAIAASSAQRLAHYLFMCKRPALSLARNGLRMCVVAAEYGAPDALALIDKHMSCLKVVLDDFTYVQAFVAAEMVGHLNVVQWLVEWHGKCDYWTDKPGAIAAKHGHEHIVRWVVENGYIRTPARKDAIMLAAATGAHTRMLHWLTAHGVEFTHKQCLAYSYWHMASDSALRLLHGGDYTHLPCMQQPVSPAPALPVAAFVDPYYDYDSWERSMSGVDESDTSSSESDSDPPPGAPQTPDQTLSSPDDRSSASQ